MAGVLLSAPRATNLFLRGSEVKINEAGGGTVFIGNSTSGTDINSNITNIGTTGLSATGRVNIGTGNNSTGSEMYLGSTSLTNLFLRGSEVKINEAGGGTVFIGNTTSGTTDINSKITNIGCIGLPATGRVNIASADTNAVGSEVYIGNSTLTNCFIRANDVNINHLNGYNIFMGSPDNGTTNILGTTYFSGNIRIGNNSNTFKNIISYKVDQSDDFPNAASPRYISFNHTFNNPPCLTVTIISNINNYVAFASVRTISTTGFTYNFTLMCLSPFTLFRAGDAHTICYTAIGT